MRKHKQTTIDELKFWAEFAGKHEDECWDTTRSVTKSGYGRTWVYPRLVYSHRIAWELTHGEIPPNMEICHKCDNPSCCNPKHLFVGTHLDNMQDSKNKGRNNHGPILHGVNHTLSKLTDSDVLAIRQEYIPTPRKKSEHNIPALAKKYSVARSLIHRIVTHKSWAHTAP